MRASSKKKKLLLIISIVISCIIIAVCVIHLPLLIYNIKHENNVCINNFTDTIAIRSELSTADILTKCRYRSAMTNLDDIGKFHLFLFSLYSGAKELSSCAKYIYQTRTSAIPNIESELESGNGSIVNITPISKIKYWSRIYCILLSRWYRCCKI